MLFGGVPWDPPRRRRWHLIGFRLRQRPPGGWPQKCWAARGMAKQRATRLWVFEMSKIFEGPICSFHMYLTGISHILVLRSFVVYANAYVDFRDVLQRKGMQEWKCTNPLSWVGPTSKRPPTKMKYIDQNGKKIGRISNWPIPTMTIMTKVLRLSLLSCTPPSELPLLSWACSGTRWNS